MDRPCKEDRGIFIRGNGRFIAEHFLSTRAEGRADGLVVNTVGDSACRFTLRMPYTLEAKCIKIFYWRHGLTGDPKSPVRMDESVERHAGMTRSHPAMTAAFLGRMLR